MSYVNPPNFKQAMASLAGTIDATFGESIRIIPCTSRPNFPTEAHEDKAVIVQGVFTAKPELVMRSNSIAHKGAEPAALVESRVPIFSFARAQLPWAINRGDRIQRSCDGSQYEITRIEADVTSQRITCHVVELGVMSQ
ncbi:hypothetical protein [Methylocystis parvus]|uniref:hypothetical protein n=1 Tax=Methylocystis parvus TaxID=134 RepID=UPI003C766904